MNKSKKLSAQKVSKSLGEKDIDKENNNEKSHDTSGNKNFFAIAFDDYE